MGFTGKEADEDVGLVYFGERYLIARVGRWASPDPLHVNGAGGGEALNAFHYVAGNLLGARDALGFFPFQIVDPGHSGASVSLGRFGSVRVFTGATTADPNGANLSYNNIVIEWSGAPPRVSIYQTITIRAYGIDSHGNRVALELPAGARDAPIRITTGGNRSAFTLSGHTPETTHVEVDAPHSRRGEAARSPDLATRLESLPTTRDAESGAIRYEDRPALGLDPEDQARLLEGHDDIVSIEVESTVDTHLVAGGREVGTVHWSHTLATPVGLASPTRSDTGHYGSSAPATAATDLEHGDPLSPGLRQGIAEWRADETTSRADSASTAASESH